MRSTSHLANQSTWIREIKYEGIQNRIKPNPKIEDQFRDAFTIKLSDLTQTCQNTTISKHTEDNTPLKAFVSLDIHEPTITQDSAIFYESIDVEK